jgi:hypothetical protein
VRSELASRGVEVFNDPDGNRWSVQQVPARG